MDSLKVPSKPRIPGKVLFNGKTSYIKPVGMLDQGATVKQCTLQKKIDLNYFHEKYGKEAVPFFAIDPTNTAHCFNEEQVPAMDEGWKILYLGYNGNSEE